MSDEAFFRSLTALELSQIKTHSYFIGLEKLDIVTSLLEAKIFGENKPRLGHNSQLLKKIFGISFSTRNLNRGLQSLNPSGLGILKKELETIKSYTREEKNPKENIGGEKYKGAYKNLLLSFKYKNL